MKGGARARSGPPPDPHALRRDRRDDGDWTTLPADGRAGDPPRWPLTRPTKRELELWAREWRRPQALMWEHNGQELEVAFLVRSIVAAEKRDAPVTLRTLVRQQMEALGISAAGLVRNRWRIGQPADTDPAAAAAPPAGGRARQRFKVVKGGRRG